MATNHSNDEQALREAVVAALEGVGQDTGQALAALRNRARMNRRLIRIQGILAGAMVIIIAILAVTLVGLSRNTKEIDDVQRRTSDQVLCPLYGAFLAAANNPIPDNIKNDPAQLEERAKAFAVIRQGYMVLDCKK